MSEKVIVCIDREFGSGGRHIGELVAQNLGIPFYGRQLIEIAAKNSGYSEQLLDDNDEQPTNSFLYSLSIGAYTFGNSITGVPEVPITDKVFNMESEIIRDIASKGSCVIVGRCAGSVLKGTDGLFTAFVHAGQEYRVNRIMEYENTTAAKAADIIKKTDKKRAGYHNFYSDARWGDPKAYDICISGDMGIEKAADILTYAVKNYR